ncbi:MAG: hypothetical protein AAFO69_05275, partial [Bacteroidota bacterium]
MSIQLDIIQKENGKGIELSFNEVPPEKLALRLMEVGFLSTPDPRKWYTRFANHPAFNDYAKKLKTTLLEGGDYLKVKASPSFKASQQNLDNYLFSHATYTITQSGETVQDSYVIFENFKVAELIARQFGIEKYGAAFIRVDVKRKGNKVKSESLLDNRKYIDNTYVWKDDISGEDSETSPEEAITDVIILESASEQQPVEVDPRMDEEADRQEPVPIIDDFDTPPISEIPNQFEDEFDHTTITAENPLSYGQIIELTRTIDDLTFVSVKEESFANHPFSHWLPYLLGSIGFDQYHQQAWQDYDEDDNLILTPLLDTILIYKTLQCKEADLVKAMLYFGLQQQLFDEPAIDLEKFLQLPYYNESGRYFLFEMIIGRKNEAWLENLKYLAEQYLEQVLLPAGIDSIHFINQVNRIGDDQSDWILLQEVPALESVANMQALPKLPDEELGSDEPQTDKTDSKQAPPIIQVEEEPTDDKNNLVQLSEPTLESEPRRSVTVLARMNTIDEGNTVDFSNQPYTEVVNSLRPFGEIFSITQGTGPLLLTTIDLKEELMISPLDYIGIRG